MHFPQNLNGNMHAVLAQKLHILGEMISILLMLIGITGNDANQTVNVGQYDANPWGFFDMHGNVWEWTVNWYGACMQLAIRNRPYWPKHWLNRVLRGGSWGDYGSPLRSANRISRLPSYRAIGMGFRLSFQSKTIHPLILTLPHP